MWGDHDSWNLNEKKKKDSQRLSKLSNFSKYILATLRWYCLKYSTRSETTDWSVELVAFFFVYMNVSSQFFQYLKSKEKITQEEDTLITRQTSKSVRIEQLHDWQPSSALGWVAKMTTLHARHQTDSGSKWCHRCKMAMHMSDGLKTNHFYDNK